MTFVPPRQEGDGPRWIEWGPVVVLALIPAIPLLAGSGIINTRAGGDSPFLLLRVHQLVRNLVDGNLPARWMPDAAYGLGYPAFNFYGVLPYYLAAWIKLAGMGYLVSIRLTQALGFLLAALAIYALARESGQRRDASLLVALVYTVAPFHLINVYVRGDSLSEFYAMALFPLILWALLRLHKQPSMRRVAHVALAYGGLVATHNVSALIFSPVVLGYTLLLAWSGNNRFRSFVRSAAGVGLGLLVSAWFWLPAIAERSNVHLGDMTSGYLNYVAHLTWNLIQPTWVFSYVIDGQQQPFRMGLVQALLAGVALLAIGWSWMRNRRLEVHRVGVIVLILGCSWMLTPSSQVVWDRVPLLPMAQFPWRFLSIQALAISLGAGYLLPSGKRWRFVALLTIGGLVLFSSLAGLRPEWLLIRKTDVNTQRLMEYEYFTANVGGTIRRDYLPAWVDPRPFTSEAFVERVAKASPYAAEGDLAASRLVLARSTSEEWVVDIASPHARLAFQTYYYPGWRAWVDGQPAAIEPLPGIGYIALRVPIGEHRVTLRFERTPLRMIAETVSLVAGLGLLGMIAWRSRRPWLVPVIIGLLVIIPLLGRLALSGITDDAPSTGRVDLTADFDRIPYWHHNPSGVRFGSVARLLDYQFDTDTISAGETIAIPTRWELAGTAPLTVRAFLVSPAYQLFGAHYLAATTDIPLSEETELRLDVPADLPRGVYLVRVGVYDADGEIAPRTERGETLGNTYLLPIRVRNQIPAANTAIPIAVFAQGVQLVRAEATQHASETLDIALSWQVAARLSQNFKVALRLRDAWDRDVAQLDVQPGYGFYPTSMWRPNEQVVDRYVLALEAGTPPGSQYHLLVTLYDEKTMATLGTARVDGITLTQPSLRPGTTATHSIVPELGVETFALAAEVEQGDRLLIDIQWLASATPRSDYACRLSLLDATGAAVQSRTLRVVEGYPCSRWPAGALVNSRYELRLPLDVPSGEYQLGVALLSADETSTEVVLPTQIRVIETQRQFTAPALDVAVGATWADRIELLGYDMTGDQAVLDLTLHLQALSFMDKPYKLFVHLIASTEERIVAQADVILGTEAHPTTNWIPDEVVTAPVFLPLSGVEAGTYRLAIGCYDEQGRLTITNAAGLEVSDERLFLHETVSVP